MAYTVRYRDMTTQRNAEASLLRIVETCSVALLGGQEPARLKAEALCHELNKALTG